MFTRNWYRIFGTYATSKTLSAVKLDGTTKTLSASTSTTTFMSALTFGSILASTHAATASSIQNYGVIFGDGNTVPAFDDYNLSGNRVTTFTFTAKVSGTEDDSGITATALYTITNTASSAITISEVALVAYNGNGFYLVERTVLDSPVTIPADGVGQVTYTIRINYPT